MDSKELMRLSAEKALNELDWDSIEYLFRPRNIGSLLLRLDFDGMRNKVYEAFCSTEPDAMPFRFRGQFWPAWNNAIEMERFYIKMKEIRDLTLKG